MRDEPVGNEVVRALDVDVVDRVAENDPLDAFDNVEPAVLREHHHPRPNRGRRHERQRVAFLARLALRERKARRVADRDVEDAPNLLDDLVDPREVAVGRLEPPTARTSVRRANGKPKSLQRLPPFVVVPEQADAVHRPRATRITAQAHG